MLPNGEFGGVLVERSPSWHFLKHRHGMRSAIDGDIVDGWRRRQGIFDIKFEKVERPSYRWVESALRYVSSIGHHQCRRVVEEAKDEWWLWFLAEVKEIHQIAGLLQGITLT